MTKSPIKNELMRKKKLKAYIEMPRFEGITQHTFKGSSSFGIAKARHQKVVM